eukprot:CAMPEP_0197183270 /NCGR_PEP_ID=MMETSP1423-20130617/7723_1 /TAXON_ID=476441 /ORGANISM="Pseudo-nitzschia heimii, Strain UNC1101" /LENGTH=636 /DNA_ID=CAMNT_0042633831 /DNA_START=365 /DNA_END=2275 /DNA_ORIENTATION=+
MAEPNDKPLSSSTENAGTGVGNSVVNDLMRVYESLTQSSTPQAEVQDASKALNLAYANRGAPHPTEALLHQPPTGYSIPSSAFHQQQETTAMDTLRIESEDSTSKIPPSLSKDGSGDDPSMTSYRSQHQSMGNSGHAPVETRTASTAIPVFVTNKDVSHRTQRSGEESHTGTNTSSTAPRISQGALPHVQQPAAEASSDSDRSASGGQLKKKRKQPSDVASTSASGGGKKGGRGKKSKKEDGRWSKRFTWPEDLHRDFVSAIFDVGLKHSSPSAIVEHMPKHEHINNERVKSHLQKYRLHRVKSKKEFISSYEASLRNLRENQSSINGALVSGSAEVAAHLTSSALSNSKTATGSATKNTLNSVSKTNPNQNENQLYNDSLTLPQLTEAEKGSPIGSAMGYLMGLFFSLKQQLMIQRSLESAGEKAKGNPLYSSSTTTKVTSGGSNVASNNPTASAVAAASGIEFVADNPMQPSHIEVNSMMKREMQNQMVLQNKMRALKQQELNKYKNISTGAASARVASDAVMATVLQDGANSHLRVAAPMNNNNVENNFVAGNPANVQQAHQQDHPPIGGNSTGVSSQGAGEIAGTDMSARTSTTVQGQAKVGSNNLLGIDNSEEFWQTDVVDDQLFEFLMNS